jgi:hypothetical protein
MPNSGRRLFSLALATAALLASAGVARSQAPQLTLKVTTSYGSNQVIYGGGSTYTVSAPPSPWITNGQVTYYYRQTDTVNGMPSPWRQRTGGLSWSTTESTPGTFDVYATVPLTTQQSPQNPTPQKVTATTATITVNVAPPNGIKQLPGPVNNVPWNLQNDVLGKPYYQFGPVPLSFPVTCAGFTPNSLPGATLTEDLIFRNAFGIVYPNQIDAKITQGGINGITLIDKKSLTIAQKDTPVLFAGFTNGRYGPGYVFYTYKQTLKLQIPDLNGTPKPFPVATFIFSQTSTAGVASPNNITLTSPPN